MYLFGTTLLVTAIAMALLSAAGYMMVIRGRQGALVYGRFGTAAMLTAVIIVWLTMIAVFLARRFDIEYVHNYSSNNLEFFFTIAASWAGQPGSFLIWTVWTGIAAALLIRRSRHFEPYTLLVLMLVQAGLLVFTLMLNPFRPMLDANTGAAIAPTDGQGLNPLLHNFWMIIHPPILFWGYALTTVPFAFAIAALWRRDYDTWVTRALPWTLAAWAFLGLALLLGGYWAYETLGWGGYWGWDPVENSSLVPWLVLTALLHGMLIQRSHGSLRRTNLLLALMAYFMVFYATFLTRSGAYANFSVHSFVAEGIYEALVIFMIALFIGGLGIFIARWRDIPVRPLSDKFFSRDSFFVLAILSLVVIALVIGFGTSMPVVSAIPGVGHTLQGWFGQAFEIDDGTAMGGQPFTDGRFSLATSFYQRTTPPLGIVIIALLIIGPLLGWRDTNMKHLLRALRWPAVAAVVAAVAAMLINVRDLLSLAYVSLGVFAIGTNLVMIIRTLRSGPLRIGGYLAHLGLCLLLIGVVGSSAYAAPEERLNLTPGETVGMYGFDFTFNGWKQTPDGKGVIDLTVRRGEDTPFNAQPQLYFNERMGSTMQTPAIKSYIWQDLYISPAEYVPETNPAVPIMGINDTWTMGPYTLTFLSFEVDREAMLKGEATPEVGAKLKVLYQGQESTLTPKVRLVANQQSADQTFQEIPVTLPGGHTLALKTFDPTRRLIMLQAEGLDLPVQPAKAVITVSTKPLVLLVWVGVGIGVLGGTIALIRRYLEGQAKLNGQPARLPRGLAGLTGRFGWRGAGK